MAKTKQASQTEAAFNSSAATAAGTDRISGSLDEATPSQAIPASAIPVTASATAGEASQPPAQQSGTAVRNTESTFVDVDSSQRDWLHSVNKAALNLLAKTEKLKRTLAEIAPLLEAVQEGFQKLRDKANLVGIPEDRRHVLGCKTFQEFIDKKLDVSKQAVYTALGTWEIKKENGIPAGDQLPSDLRPKPPAKKRNKGPSPIPDLTASPPQDGDSIQECDIHVTPTSKTEGETITNSIQFLRLLEDKYRRTLDTVFGLDSDKEIVDRVQVLAERLLTNYISDKMKATVNITLESTR